MLSKFSVVNYFLLHWYFDSIIILKSIVLSSVALLGAREGLFTITTGTELSTWELYYGSTEISEKLIHADELLGRKQVEVRKLSLEITFIFIWLILTGKHASVPMCFINELRRI